MISALSFVTIAFEVPTGTIFGMIGPSGCGKTTTVRLMTGLYKPDRGNLTVMNRMPSKFSPRDRERIGYMPQHFVLYPNLTVWENLSFVASLYGMGYFKRRKYLEQALEFVELSDARNRLGRKECRDRFDLRLGEIAQVRCMKRGVR